jgi:8-oxo-dGTP diphosphatase
MLRPITKEGWRQARALVTLLEGFEVDCVVSSPWLRCRQTVSPLAEQRGLEVKTDRLLSDCFSIERAMAVLDGIGERPALVCTHTDVMAALMERLESAPIRAEAGSWLRAIKPGHLGVAS